MNYTQQAPRRKNYTPLPNEVFDAIIKVDTER